MSTDVEFYILIAVDANKIEVNDELRETLTDNFYDEKFTEIVMLNDGMCGKYSFIGKILHKEEYFEPELFEMDVKTLQSHIDTVKEGLEKLGIDGVPKLYYLQHIH